MLELYNIPSIRILTNVHHFLLRFRGKTAQYYIPTDTHCYSLLLSVSEPPNASQNRNNSVPSHVIIHKRTNKRLVLEWGCRGLRSLPEREVSSYPSLDKKRGAGGYAPAGARGVLASFLDKQRMC